MSDRSALCRQMSLIDVNAPRPGNPAWKTLSSYHIISCATVTAWRRTAGYDSALLETPCVSTSSSAGPQRTGPQPILLLSDSTVGCNRILGRPSLWLHCFDPCEVPDRGDPVGSRHHPVTDRAGFRRAGARWSSDCRDICSAGGVFLLAQGFVLTSGHLV